MSLASWKAEFYPIPASRVKKRDALAHSLRKWQGLTRVALKHHGVKSKWGELSGERGERAFVIDGHSCALCHYYSALDSELHCVRCPLYIIRGGVSCDCLRPAEECCPYGEFVSFNRALPMISWLKRAIKAQGSKP